METGPRHLTRRMMLQEEDSGNGVPGKHRVRPRLVPCFLGGSLHSLRTGCLARFDGVRCRACLPRCSLPACARSLSAPSSRSHYGGPACVDDQRQHQEPDQPSLHDRFSRLMRMQNLGCTGCLPKKVSQLRHGRCQLHRSRTIPAACSATRSPRSGLASSSVSRAAK